MQTPRALPHCRLLASPHHRARRPSRPPRLQVCIFGLWTLIDLCGVLGVLCCVALSLFSAAFSLQESALCTSQDSTGLTGLRCEATVGSMLCYVYMLCSRRLQVAVTPSRLGLDLPFGRTLGCVGHSNSTPNTNAQLPKLWRPRGLRPHSLELQYKVPPSPAGSLGSEDDDA